MGYCSICKNGGKKGATAPMIRIPPKKWDREKLVSLLLCDEAVKTDIMQGKWKDRRICYIHAPGWHSWKNRWAKKDEAAAGEKKGISEMLREAKDAENGAKELTPQPLVGFAAQSQESGESMYSMPLPKKIKKQEQSEEWHPVDTDHSMDEALDDVDGPWDGQTKFLISGDKILELVEKIAGFSCLCYEKRLRCLTRRYSTSAILTLSCQNCDKRVKWNSLSSEGEKDEREGTLNYHLPLAATLTGNSYTRLYAMAKLLNIAIPSPRTARRAMANYGWAAVEEVYKRDEGDTKRRIQETYGTEHPKIDVEADGQYDSPGYSSLICKVTFFETNTGLCLLSNTMDKRKEGCTSAGMELIGVKRGLEDIETMQLSTRSLTTDKNSAVGKYMATTHGPQSARPITHFLDFWHIVKNCHNKILKAIKKKKNAHLVDWRKSIVNYLYAVREKGGGNAEMIRELMWAMFYHIVDTHRWPGDKRFKRIKRCLHARVHRKKAFLVPGGEAMKTLCSIIDDAFIEGMTRVSPSGSTSRLESFHSLSLMYTPKSNYVDKEVYRKRTLCAVLRYNWLRKAELDGKRGVARVCQVSRKFRDGTTTKKVRSGGEEHLWMREVLEVASFLKIQRRLETTDAYDADYHSTASSEASHDSDTEEEISEFELSDVDIADSSESESSSSDSEFEY